MTLAGLTINEKKKRICGWKRHNYKNLHTAVFKQTKFVVRKAKLKTQFGKIHSKTRSYEKIFF